MAFTLESGFGVAGANAYASVAFFRAHHTDRGVSGVDVGTLTDSVVEGLLVRATDYVEQRFGSRWIGVRKWDSLPARSVLSMTAVPTAGETVTVGSVAYTFRASPVADTDVEIMATVQDSLRTLAGVMNRAENADLFTAVVDDWSDTLAVYTASSGVETTDAAADAGFDRSASSGASAAPQALGWPRLSAYDANAIVIRGVPDTLRRAVAEYALRANSGALLADRSVDDSGFAVSRKREKVGPIETESEYRTAAGDFRRFPSIDLTIAPLVVPGGRLVRM
jgi:hypothetical protein